MPPRHGSCRPRTRHATADWVTGKGRFAEENAASPGQLQGMARAAQGDMHGNETR